MQITNESLYGLTMHKASDYRLTLTIDGANLANLEPRFEVTIGGATFKFSRFAYIDGQEIFIIIPKKYISRMSSGHGRYFISIGNGDNSDVVLYGNVKVVE